jgi:hypothetical protein
VRPSVTALAPIEVSASSAMAELLDRVSWFERNIDDKNAAFARNVPDVDLSSMGFDGLTGPSASAAVSLLVLFDWRRCRFA